MSATIEQLRWLCGRDTGVSSATIWRVMTGEEPERYDRYAERPLDIGDMGRCIRLLDLFPEWRPRLPEVAARYPRWAPLVETWDEIVAAYRNGDAVAGDAALRRVYANRCCCGDYPAGGGPTGETHSRNGCDMRLRAEARRP